MSRSFGYRICLAACLTSSCLILRASPPTVSLNPAITYQTFSGWEAVVVPNVRVYKGVLAAYDDLFDRAVNDLGITRVQIAVNAGIEHPAGPAAQYLDGKMTGADFFGKYGYDIVNDNSKPNVADLNGFDFTLLDWEMEHMVLPFKRRVEGRGDRLYSYLSYVDFGKSRFEHYDHPAEYAEFILVLFEHLRTAFDFVPDGLNVMNEPDQTPWTADMMGRAIAKTGPRLAAAGFHPDFMAASTMDKAQAVPFFEDIRSVRAARPYLKELSYHCYADRGVDTLARIAEAAVRYGVRTVMNECWGGVTYEALHRDLKTGRNSAWQQGNFDGPGGYYTIDRPTLAVTLNAKTKLMRQYYRYIRPGARRIDATTTDASFDPLAFINADGTYVTVIKTQAAGSCLVENLPAGTYRISYTTDVEYDIHLPDVTVDSGQALVARVPGTGVITVYGKRSPGPVQ